ncbi:PQQ-binding-like beta-propeller repeat protein [Halospeciosus flavus]|uniref:PQQ-binding-like beta-propeller repeat protein n=1 Tax=Halospeciosus flavus TaxID=3032283 RepID=A0ABD5Z3Q4_9EURY|nr:PQQ-binding-like beta-propeller repeat protein [Halospeciosus flavus]
MPPSTRRRVLHALGTGFAVGAAGCATTGTTSTTTRTTAETTTSEPTETTETTDEPANFASEDWRVESLNGPVQAFFLPNRPPTPETLGGPLYTVTESGQIARIAVADGTVEWTVDLTGVQPDTDSFVTTGEHCFPVSDTRNQETLRNYVDAVNLATGERQWTFEAREFLTALGVVDGMLYLAGHYIKAPPSEIGPERSAKGEGRLHAVDIATGEEQWSSTLPALRGATVADHGLYATAWPEEASELRLHAFDLDGTERWVVGTGAETPHVPAVVEEGVLAGTASGFGLYASGDGDVRWRVQKWQSGAREIVVLDDGTIAAGWHPVVTVSQDGTVTHRLADRGMVVLPATPSTLYVVTGSSIIAGDRRSGGSRWRYDPEDAKYTHIQAIIREWVAVDKGVGRSQELLFLDEESGAVGGRLTAPGDYHDVVGLGEKLFVGTDAGVYAYVVNA